MWLRGQRLVERLAEQVFNLFAVPDDELIHRHRMNSPSHAIE
jgi:hypothetical protein